MKVLITGAGGQVARQLAIQRPEQVLVHAIDRAQLDIADRDSVRHAMTEFAPDVVINAAGYTAVDKAEQEPEVAMLANAAGPRLLALAASAMPHCRLIQISSDYVFSGAGGRPYAHDGPTEPASAYGRSKLAGERAVIEALGTRAVVLRTSWVYGASGHNFLQTMLRLMKTQGRVRVVVDQVGTPTSTPALAQVLWAIASRADLSGILHWSDAGVASWYDFAVAIAEEATSLGFLPPGVEVVPIATRDFPTPAMRPAYSVLDKQVTVSALSIEPLHWRVRLREVLRSMKDA